VASGNNVQVPVNVPLNICGNTVDVVAALNPAFGNSCANDSDSHGRHVAPRDLARYDASSVHGSGHTPGRGGAAHSGGGYGDRSGAGYGGYSGEHGSYSGHSGGGYGGENGGQGGYGGHGGEYGGYGDSGHGHSGYGDSEYGESGHRHSGHGGPAYDNSGAHHGGWNGSSSYGGTQGSPGVLSGDQVAVPLDVPVELCGNTADVIALLNPVFGNECGHHHAPDGRATTPHHCHPRSTTPHNPPRTVHEHPPTRTPYTPVMHTPPPALAETGSEGLLAITAASAALLAGGTVLYRRNRAASRP
jgi:hypothetical protein